MGLFAKDFVRAGEIVAYKAGHIVDEQFIRDHADIVQGSHVQIADTLFLAPVSDQERMDDVLIGYNHSCSPNGYVSGQIAIRAMRDIQPDEEITVDYATAFTSDTQEFDCVCGSVNCRKRIQPSSDWQKPELQKKYRGYFADFIKGKIDAGS